MAKKYKVELINSKDSTQNLEGIVIGKDQDYWLSALINSPIYSKFPKCLSKDVFKRIK